VNKWGGGGYVPKLNKFKNYFEGFKFNPKPVKSWPKASPVIDGELSIVLKNESNPAIPNL